MTHWQASSALGLLLTGLGLRLPVIASPFGTFETARAVASARA